MNKKYDIVEYRFLIILFYFSLIISFGGCDSGGISGDSSDKDNPEIITIESIEELQKIGNEDNYPLDGKYALGKDIDAKSTSSWNNGKGFKPIGKNNNSSQGFTGEFMGNGNEISNLFIDRPDESFVGLFGRIDGDASIENIRLTDIDITGDNFVGGLVGINIANLFGAGVSNIRVTGHIKSANDDGKRIGGIVGANGAIPSSIFASDTSRVQEISNLRSDVTVEGGISVGGIVGKMNAGIIRDARSEGTVSGQVDVGGLVGNTDSGTSFPLEEKRIVDSHSSSNVEGNERVGGWLEGMAILQTIPL